jgi:YVTN family beta-propeller protein
MEYRLLGPLEVLDASGRKLPLGGAMRQSVLASLLLRAGQTVGLERLIDDLWDEPPESAARSVQAYISRLRHQLPEGMIESRPGGYALLLNGDRLDLHTFEQTSEQGRAALATGDWERARQLLRDALALWRGPALAGLPSDALRREAERLEELRLQVLEDRLEADLGRGSHREVVAELQALVAQQPFRERLRVQLMLALYRAGRQTEALDVYQDARRILVDGLGIEPSAPLREFEQAILRQDSSLAPPTPAAPPVVPATPETESIYRGLLEAPAPHAGAAATPGPRQPPGAAPPADLEREPGGAFKRRLVSRRGVVAAAVIVALTAAAVAGVRATRGGSSHSAPVAADSVGFFDSGSGRLVGDVGVGATPTHTAVGKHAIWVTNADGDDVSRIDPVRRTVVQTIPVGSSPSGITTGNGAVWVVNSLDGTVSRIDPGTNTVVQKIRVGNAPVGIVYASGSVWVANTADDTITRIDADSGTPAKPLPIAATELAFGAGTLWASERASNHVVRIDPTTGKLVQSIPVGNGPTGIAFGHDAAWVANTLDGTVSRIDPETNSQAAVIPIGNGPTAVAVDAHGVWVSNEFGGTLVRIDPRKNQAARPIHVGNRPLGVATASGNVLVAVRESGADHRGGTLTLRSDLPLKGTALDSIDTAVAYVTTSVPLLRMTGDGLVAFNQVSGLAGTQLVPDLAVSLPTPTDGGRTYAFRLRPGVRYSTGAPVKPSDFRATIERDFEIGSKVTYYDGIVGAARCKTRRRRCDLSHGIVADDAAKTVTFHLVAPDPDFLYKLALSFVYVLPAGSPAHDVGTRPLPATGPYVIASYRPKHLLRLIRNKYFHEWSQAAQPDGYPDEIVLRIGGSSDAAIGDVLAGKADVIWLSRPLVQRQVTEVKTRYASQVHTDPTPTILALFLNTRVPPFDLLDVRRALNYAANRAAVLQANGGPDVGQPTCQILPPGFPGHRPYCPYTAGAATHGVWRAPNLGRARALVARSGTRGMKVTVWFPTEAAGFNRFAVKLLRSLGYRVSTKILGNNYQAVVSDSRNKAQIGSTGWSPDYPAASDFFGPLFSCASFVPDSRNNSNVAKFCDPSIDRLIERALREQTTNPAASRALWERVDKEVVDQAPWVPLFTTKSFDILSRRVGNYQYSPTAGELVDQLWVR